MLASTPGSKLIHKPTSNEKLAETRRIQRAFHSKIESEYKQNDASLVMGNRISWSTYDKIRKTDSLQKKRKGTDMTGNPEKRKKHGTAIDTLSLSTTALLDEAKSWPTTKSVNWSELARSYGLQQKNGGQIIKEYLASYGIAQAINNERPKRAQRSAKKKTTTGVSFPMHAPASVHKQTIKAKVENKEILLGDNIAEQEVRSYKVNVATKTIETVTNKVSARRIKLSDIRQKMADDHNKLGLIRDSSDNYFSSLGDEAIEAALSTLHMSTSGSVSELRDRLKKAYRTRHLKVWHDHSEIAGHGHLLVLVAAIYDPAFFYTSQELESKGIHLDVEAIIERPYVHILGRSKSSLIEQAQFIEYRFEEVQELSTTVSCTTHTITDVLRVFHGDGPAQQVEAGAKIGGNYPCVGCTARSILFDDLAHCFRADSLSLQDRQQFVLKGKAWKRGGTKPLDGLSVAELKEELKAHAKPTQNKTREELLPVFEELRAGINHVTALVQNHPTADIAKNNMECYEIIPTEPLHDLKGHLGNLIEETVAQETGAVQKAIEEVIDTVLSKDTLRCSDYRKAVIIIYKALLENNAAKKKN